MPLITTAPSLPAPPPVPQAPGPQTLGLTYVDPDGTVWTWGDPGQSVFATDVAGIGSPPVALTSLGLPGGGVLAQALTPQMRTIVIGLRMYNDEGDQDAFLQLMDRLARALWTTRAGLIAPATLIVSRPDGTSRQIDVLCTDGPSQATDDATKSGLTWSSMVITLVAPDPLWSDAQTTQLEFATPPAGGGVPAMPPVVLDPSTILGSTTVTNDGDGDAYPIWTITGPGIPTIANTTTGLSFGLDVTLGVGEVVTVDTRTGMQSAIDAAAANRWADLVRSSPRALWPLVPGDNALNLQMTGAGVGTKIAMSYTRRWLRA
ncbi:MAG: phage tail protein [Actinomycetia bacterium]|nr:phage tail protein [Actinomycetes bacterium]